jgi:predicted NUDIX family NTP pyrophosphohydrolase
LFWTHAAAALGSLGRKGGQVLVAHVHDDDADVAAAERLKSVRVGEVDM